MMFSSSADKIEKAVSETKHCCRSVHPKRMGRGTQTTLMRGEVLPQHAAAIQSPVTKAGRSDNLGFGWVRVIPVEDKREGCVMGRTESWLSIHVITDLLNLMNACIQLTFSFEYRQDPSPVYGATPSGQVLCPFLRRVLVPL